MKRFLSVLMVFFLITPILLSQDKKNKEEKTFPNWKVYGYVFGDYYGKVNGDTSGSSSGEYAKISKDKNAFDFRRVLFGLDYDISEDFSAEFALSYDAPDQLVAGNRTPYIRFANIRWKNLIPYSTILLGQMSTPTFSLISEKVWGYRFVEKDLLDFRKIGSSIDFGLAVWGEIDKSGNYGYNVMFGNGRGAKIEDSKFKKYYGSVYSYFWEKRIIAEVYADYEDITSSTNKTTYKGFVGLILPEARAGVEVFQQVQRRFFSDGTNVNPFGVSFFAIGNLLKEKLSIFGRFDYYDPDMNHPEKGFKEYFLNFGVDFMPHKSVHLVPNIWIDAYKDKSPAGTERKADIVPRLTFYYIYK